MIKTVDAQFVEIKRLSAQLFSLLSGRLNKVLRQFLEQQILPCVKSSQQQEFLDYIASYCDNGLLYESLTRLHSIGRINGYFPFIPPTYAPSTSAKVVTPKTKQIFSYCDTFLDLLSKVPDKIFNKYGAFNTFEIDFKQKFGIYKYLNYGSFVTKLQIFSYEEEDRSLIRYGEQVLTINQGILRDISLLNLEALPESVIRQIFVEEGWESSPYMNRQDLSYKLYNIVEGREYCSVSRWQIELTEFLSKKRLVNLEFQHYIGEAIDVGYLPCYSCSDFIRLKQDCSDPGLLDEFLKLVDTIASKLEIEIDNLGQHSKYPQGLLELVYRDFADI